MNKYKIFYKAPMTSGILNSVGRGETGWICSVARVLDEMGHNLYIFPYRDSPYLGKNAKFPEEPEPLSDRAVLIPRLKNDPSVYNEMVGKNEFDIAIFLIDQKCISLIKEVNPNNPNKVKAKLYIWGTIWEGEADKGPYDKNDIIVRQFRWHMNMSHNSKEHTHFLLARALGKQMGKSKFSNRRIGWVPKFAFSDGYSDVLHLRPANRLLNAMVDAANETNTGITIFSSDLITEEKSCQANVRRFKVMETLSRAKDIKFLPTCPPNIFNEELKKCSVVFPIGSGISGSVLEAIFFGITPLIFKDSLLMNYPGIVDVAKNMTFFDMCFKEEKWENNGGVI